MEDIKNTLTYKMVSEEARELSWKLQNTIFVICSGNTLYTTLNGEKGKILSAYNLGNKVK
jgi:hypothetical protein